MTGVYCPHCGAKSDSSPCDNCGEEIKFYGREPGYEQRMYKPSEQVERFKRNVDKLTHEQCKACLKEIVDGLLETRGCIDSLRRAGVFGKEIKA